MNLLSNDGQRIFEAVAIGPIMLPGPIMLLFGIIYTLIMIGPWAVVAMGTFVLFYPFMVIVFLIVFWFARLHKLFYY